MHGVNNQTQEKRRCSTCGQIISEREIALYRGLVSLLWRIFKWCEEKNRHEFKRKEVKHLFLNENDTARFGDWAMFGGLVYKLEKAKYGLNMERCEEFFAGKYSIPTRIWKNPMTGELRKEDYKAVHEIPSILEMLDEDQQYIARYRRPRSKMNSPAAIMQSNEFETIRASKQKVEEAQKQAVLFR